MTWLPTRLYAQKGVLAGVVTTHLTLPAILISSATAFTLFDDAEAANLNLLLSADRF